MSTPVGVATASFVNFLFCFYDGPYAEPAADLNL